MSIAGSDRSSVSKPKVVRFQLAYNLKSLLQDFVTEKDRKLYEELVCHIRDVGQEIRDDDLVQLLKEARGCISMLDGNLRLFVQVVLILKWTHRSPEVVSEYQGFLLDLCSAHNYYTKLVLDHLVTCFKTVAESEWVDCKPSESEEQYFQHVHNVIRAVLSVIPMSKGLLITSITNQYPYLKKPIREHQSYVYNLLRITIYNNSLSYDILNLIVLKLIALDVHTPRNELEQLESMEEDAGPCNGDETMFEMEPIQKPGHPVGNALDLCLTIVFEYIRSQCYDETGQLVWDKTKRLYGYLFRVFDASILPTHAINHTQFLIFYLISFKPTLAMSFISSLWGKVTNPSLAPILRQTAVCYIASLLSRAKFISISVIYDMLTEFSHWIHSYIDCQDGSRVTQDTRVHQVFYATCQAMFYVIAFMHKELVCHNKGLVFLQSLNVSKIVTCRLNPLRVCQPAVASKFASVARSYQLAYCYTVMEHNARTSLPVLRRNAAGVFNQVAVEVTLEAFFPFDPYLLDRSFSFIEPIYREYTEGMGSDDTGSGGSGQKQVEPRDEDDDFLEQQPTNDSLVPTFTYGSSPGFLQV